MNWISKAKEDLNKIISNQCLESYLKMNRKKDGTFYKKHRPYTIPEESQRAVEYLTILEKENVSIQEEEEIKFFLLPFRTYRNFI